MKLQCLSSVYCVSLIKRSFCLNYVHKNYSLIYHRSNQVDLLGILEIIPIPIIVLTIVKSIYFLSEKFLQDLMCWSVIVCIQCSDLISLKNYPVIVSSFANRLINHSSISQHYNSATETDERFSLIQETNYKQI